MKRDATLDERFKSDRHTNTEAQFISSVSFVNSVQVRVLRYMGSFSVINVRSDQNAPCQPHSIQGSLFQVLHHSRALYEAENTD